MNVYSLLRHKKALSNLEGLNANQNARRKQRMANVDEKVKAHFSNFQTKIRNAGTPDNLTKIQDNLQKRLNTLRVNNRVVPGINAIIKKTQEMYEQKQKELMGIPNNGGPTQNFNTFLQKAVPENENRIRTTLNGRNNRSRYERALKEYYERWFNSKVGNGPVTFAKILQVARIWFPSSLTSNLGNNNNTIKSRRAFRIRIHPDTIGRLPGEPGTKMMNNAKATVLFQALNTLPPLPNTPGGPGSTLPPPPPPGRRNNTPLALPAPGNNRGRNNTALVVAGSNNAERKAANNAARAKAAANNAARKKAANNAVEEARKKKEANNAARKKKEANNAAFKNLATRINNAKNLTTTSKLNGTISSANIPNDLKTELKKRLTTKRAAITEMALKNAENKRRAEEAARLERNRQANQARKKAEQENAEANRIWKQQAEEQRKKEAARTAASSTSAVNNAKELQRRSNAARTIQSRVRAIQAGVATRSIIAEEKARSAAAARRSATSSSITRRQSLVGVVSPKLQFNRLYNEYSNLLKTKKISPFAYKGMLTRAFRNMNETQKQERRNKYQKRMREVSNKLAVPNYSYEKQL
jgi:hypothetical protein